MIISQKYNKILLGSSFCLCLLCGTSAMASHWSYLGLEQNTIAVGGSAAFPMQFGRGDFTRVDLAISPEVGVFVIDYLLISLHGSLQGPVVNNIPFSDPAGVLAWTLSLQARYFLDFGFNIYPYVGLGAGLLMTNLSYTSSRIAAELPIGVQIALHDQVALQIGFPTKAIFSVARVFDYIEFSPAQLSLLAYF